MSVSKTFSESEVEDIMRLSRSRHDAKHINIRNVGSLNKAKDDTDPKQYTAHFTGLIGEYVWAWHSNQEVDKRVFAHGDKEDFKDEEVKTVTYVSKDGKSEPELKVPIKEFDKKNHIKNYILTWTDSRVIERILITGKPEPISAKILGKISREDFKSKCIQFQYRPGYPINYIVKASQLGKA